MGHFVNLTGGIPCTSLGIISTANFSLKNETIGNRSFCFSLSSENVYPTSFPFLANLIFPLIVSISTPNISPLINLSSIPIDCFLLLTNSWLSNMPSAQTSSD